MNLTDGIAEALAYIEEHLDGELDVSEAAARAYLSEFYFQRIFGALCGITVGEYIRGRRLTLAARELAASDARVIDVALKYGWSSPDSFARAFARFHGVSPSAAKAGAALRSLAPLKIKLTLEGGNMTDYRIVHKEAFSLVGTGRRFSAETSYAEIPKFWDEFLASPEKPVHGMFGVCLDTGINESGMFDYLIADIYEPWHDVPAGCSVQSFAAGDWAVFPCTLETLQDTNTRMWSEWLPGVRDYRLRDGFNLECYLPGGRVELWLPVEKV